MDFTLKTEKSTYNIKGFPDCWEVTSTRLYQNVIRKWEPEVKLLDRDPGKLLSILSGIDTPFSIVNLSTDSDLWKAMRFVYEQPTWFDALPLPNFFIFEGRKYKVPMRIKELSIGQNLMMKQAMQSEKANSRGEIDLRPLVSKAIAIYMQPIIDGKLKTSRVAEIEEQVLEMPITATYSLGFFLLNRLKNSGWRLPSYWSRLMISLGAGGLRLFPNWLRLKPSTRGQI